MASLYDDLYGKPAPAASSGDLLTDLGMQPKANDKDGAFKRGWEKAKGSMAITANLAAQDAGGAAQAVADADAYAQANKGMVEGSEMMDAWQKGDGISGGIKGVLGEIGNDWNQAVGVGDKLTSVGKNAQAMGEGLAEQTANMVAPMTGQLAGGIAGAKVGGAIGSLAGPVGAGIGATVGGIGGQWLGASTGNTAVEGGGMAMEALNKAGINPQDTAAVTAFLESSGNEILKESAIKGGIIGAVDVATMGLAHGILTGPAKAATDRALTALGVDFADKAAVKAAQQSPAFANMIAGDAAYQASKTGAGNVARNVTAAGLDPAGEFVGEYAGTGVATGEWDEKNAALEAISSLGQSGIMYAGQKGYQALTKPKSGDPLIQPPSSGGGTPPPAGSPPADNLVQPTPTVENPAPAPVVRPDPANGVLSRATNLLPAPAVDDTLYGNSSGEISPDRPSWVNPQNDPSQSSFGPGMDKQAGGQIDPLTGEFIPAFTSPFDAQQSVTGGDVFESGQQQPNWNYGNEESQGPIRKALAGPQALLEDGRADTGAFNVAPDGTVAPGKVEPSSTKSYVPQGGTGMDQPTYNGMPAAKKALREHPQPDSMEIVATGPKEFTLKQKPADIAQPNSEAISIPFRRKQYNEATGKTEDVEGASDIIDYAGRKIVMRLVNGVKVPFYLSTGNGGKADVEAGKWYPFFGIGKGDGWLNKLGGKEINDFYGIPELRTVAEQLNASIGDVRGDKHEGVGATGQHMDFLSQDLNEPTDNGSHDTRTRIDESIRALSERIAAGRTSAAEINPAATTASVQASPEAVERTDGTTDVVSDKGMSIVHGSGNPALTAGDIQIVRTGQKQGKKGRSYGGLYGTSEEDSAQAEGYAGMMGGTPTLYDVTVNPGTKILNKTGDITRLSEAYIDELVAQGYGVVRGVDPRGRKETVVIDKAAIASMKARQSTAKPATTADQAAVSPETVTAPATAEASIQPKTDHVANLKEAQRRIAAPSKELKAEAESAGVDNVDWYKNTESLEYAIKTAKEGAQSSKTNPLAVTDNPIAVTQTPVSAKPAKRKGARKTVDREKDTVVEAVIRLGGISNQWKQDTTGDTKGNKGIPGVGYLWSDKNGTGIDDMARHLDDEGYVPHGEMQKDGGVSWLQSVIKDELGGIKKHYAPGSAKYEADALQREADRFAAQADRFDGESDAEYEDQIDALFDRNLTEQEIEAQRKADDDWLAEADELLGGSNENSGSEATPGAAISGQGQENQTPAGRLEQEGRAGTGEGSGAGEQGAESASPAFTLEAQTEEDLTAKEKEQQAAAEAQAAEQQALENKVKADAEVGSFTLTGSNRPSDVGAAAGQNDMFGPKTRGETKAEAESKPVEAETKAPERAEPNLVAAKALLEENKKASGNAVAQGALRKKVRELAAKTPISDERTVAVLDILATRLDMNDPDSKYKDVEYAPAAAISADTKAQARKPEPAEPKVMTQREAEQALADAEAAGSGNRISNANERYMKFDREIKEAAARYGMTFGDKYDPEPAYLPKSFSLSKAAEYAEIAWPDALSMLGKAGAKRELKAASEDGRLEYAGKKKINVNYNSEAAPSGTGTKEIPYKTFTRQSVDALFAQLLDSKSAANEATAAKKDPEVTKPAEEQVPKKPMALREAEQALADAEVADGEAGLERELMKRRDNPADREVIKEAFASIADFYVDAKGVLGVLAKNAVRDRDGENIKDALMERTGGDLAGIQLASKDGRQWAFFLPEASEPGRVRVSFFDSKGFFGHSTRDTYAQLLDEAFSDGYRTEVTGKLEELAATESFAKGNELVSKVQAVNAGQMSWKDFIDGQKAGDAGQRKQIKFVSGQPSSEYLADGSIIEDGNGQQYRVHYQRNDLVLAHPIIDGKANVNSESGVRFHIGRPESADGRRTDPIYLVQDRRDAGKEEVVGSPAKAAPKKTGKIDDVGEKPYGAESISAEFPLEEATNSYSGISHRGRSNAIGDRDEYERAISTAVEEARPLAETPEQLAVLAAGEAGFRAEYIDEYARMMRVRASTYSGHIAGGSNLNTKQVTARNAALDKAQARFGDWLGAQNGRLKSAVLNARTPEVKAKEADEIKQAKDAKAAKKKADSVEFMTKLLTFKTGSELRIGNATVIKINKDRDGYPSSLIFTNEDGSTPFDNKIDIARALYKGDKAELRADADAARKAIGEPEAKGEKPAAQSAPAKEPSKTPLLDNHVETMDGVRNGTATVEQYRAAFFAVDQSAEAIKAELKTKTKDELLRSGGGFFHTRNKGETKQVIIDKLYRALLSEFALGKSYGPSSYMFGQHTKHEDIKQQALRDLVAGQTDETLAAFAEETAASRAEVAGERAKRMEAIENPKTLEDFNSAVRFHVNAGKTAKDARLLFTPQQRITYDELAAEVTREARERNKRANQTAVNVAGQTVGGEIVATKHTKTGADLFVVKLAERVSKEDYGTMLASAKRMGGWYSAFRGNGAVPGFQFKERDGAEAFLKLAAGDKADAEAHVEQRRDYFSDDRSQSAVERLTEMAERLDERADESLNANRKVNTSRRASQAASAESSARSDKALAATMRNLAEAIKDGKAKFLDAVRQKVQVELLNSIVHDAKYQETLAKYPSYADQLAHQGEKATALTADHAEFPNFTAYRSDLASLARQMLEVDGTKKIGQRLMTAADDVTNTYLEFAKANFHKVSTFSNGKGELAKFSSREDAQTAIRRSNLTGTAIVLPLKRGENIIILSPSEAINRGIWKGDGDKRIFLTKEFGAELVAQIGKAKGGKITVPWQFESAQKRLAALSKMGIETPAEFRSALREFIALREQAAAPDKIKELERAMIGRRNDGLDFFPTPAAAADAMIEAADIQEGMSVLEPSAGMGHIAERIRAAGTDPDVVELSSDRRELLEAKGFRVVANDFMEMSPRGFTFGDVFRAADGTVGVMRGQGGLGSNRVRLIVDGNERAAQYKDRDELVEVEKRGTDSGYDRIIMNPPFSDRRDAEHIKHAFTLLKPGGRLVAIAGEGVFFGSDKKGAEFREWLDANGATVEKLPDGTFNDPSLPVNTGANARMVVIDKPTVSANYRLNIKPSKGIPLFSAQAIAKKLNARLGLKVQAVANETGLPAAVQAQIKKDNASGQVAGVYHEGVSYVIASNLYDTKHAIETVLHEAIGHGGVKAVLGEKLGKVMRGIYRDMPKAMRAELERRYATKLEGLSEAEREIEVAEEYVAHMAETDPRSPLISRLVAQVRKFIRSVFGEAQAMKWTRNDIVQLLAEARSAVAKGDGPKGSGKSYRERAEQFAAPELAEVTEASEAEFVASLKGPAVQSMAASLYKARGTDSPFFKNWFGKSRMVKDGKPVGFYHRSFGDMTNFDDARLGSSTGTATAALGHYLSIKDVGNVDRYGPVADQFYIKMEKPKVISQAQFEAMGDWDIEEVKSYRAKLMKAGHDGMYVQGLGWPIVFEGKNIKGVRNAGTFDESGRTRYNLGDKIKQTATANFKKWFGESKVVDADGKPLVVYHETDADFAEFRIADGVRSKADGEMPTGAFFKPDPRSIGVSAEGQSQMPVYLSISNPLVVADRAELVRMYGREIDGYRELVEKEQDINRRWQVDPRANFAVESIEKQAEFDAAINEWTAEVDAVAAQQKELINAWFKGGDYDGLIVENDRGSMGRSTKSYVVFDQTKIKSAIGNNGDFDGSNPDIRYSLNGTSEALRRMAGRFNGRPLDRNDPYAEENRRLREDDKSLWHRAKKEFARQFAPGGLLPTEVFDEKITRDSEFQAVEFEVRHMSGRLADAVKNDYGTEIDALPEAQMRVLAEALSGRVDDSIPEATKVALVAMRQYIDSLSGEYLSILQAQIEANMQGADQALIDKITGNLGAYVNRSYQAFDDPKWFKTVPTEVVNAAREYLASGYIAQGETAEEAARLADVTVNEMLKNGTAYDSMGAFIAESKLGAKDLSVLIKRKEIAPEIRALLGEYIDPRLNFAKSATKMGRLVWNQRFLDRVLDIGMGSFLFEGKNRPADATVQIAGETSDTYAPLNGLWTFQEVAQSFKDALGKEEMSELYRTIVRLNGMVKYGKTILSPTTAMRNWQSAMFFSLANGHFDLTQMKKSWAALREQVLQNADGDDLAYLHKLKRLGVVYDTPYAGEMMALMQDARMDELLSGKNSTGFKWLRKANQFAQGFYSFGDDFWKIIGYENEKAGLIAAGIPLEEAEKMAAKRIRNTYPTYSMIGKGVQWLRRFPLAGTFVSFPSEIIRTSVNMLRITAEDLKSENPGIRALGRKRAIGIAMTSAGFYALAAITAAAAGVDDDEEEALRDLAAPWSKNSTFLFTGRDEDGKLRYFDLSFLDPYGYWKRPLTAMLRDQPWEDAAASGLSDMLSPFFGADITAGAIFEVMSNKKPTGGQVYNENAGSIDQLQDIANHMRKALQPGFVSNAERLWLAGSNARHEGSGQPYDMRDELVSLLGWRAATLDTQTGLYYRSFEFTDALSDAKKTLTRTLRSSNDVSDGDIGDSKEAANTQYQKAFTEMGRLVRSASAAGMSRQEIVSTLKLSGVSQRNVFALISGKVPPIDIGVQTQRNAVMQASVMRDREHAMEIVRRFKVAREE